MPRSQMKYKQSLLHAGQFSLASDYDLHNHVILVQLQDPLRNIKMFGVINSLLWILNVASEGLNNGPQLVEKRFICILSERVWCVTRRDELSSDACQSIF